MTATHNICIQQQRPAFCILDIGEDSFVSDLLLEFDKNQSRLRAEMDCGNISLSNGSEYNVANSTVSTINESGNNMADDIRRQSAYQILERKFKTTATVLQQQQGKDMSTTPPPELQHRSLLRTWSFSKTLRQKQSRKEQQQNNDLPREPQPRSALRSWSSLKRKRPQQLQNKEAVSSGQPWYHSLVQPLLITQYPPPPLKYGPVEPASQTVVMPSSQHHHHTYLPVKDTSRSTWTQAALKFAQRFSCHPECMVKARGFMEP